MTEHEKAPPLIDCIGGTGRDRQNQIRIAVACLGWALCFLGATIVLKQELAPPGPLRWLTAAVPSVAAVFLLAAYARFLRDADELQRLIQLNALAVGFGGGYFAILGYRLFERAGAPVLGIDVVIVMPFLYVIAMLVGWRRYQ